MSFKFLSHRALRFILSGILITALDWIFLNFFVVTGLSPASARLLSFLLALIVSFLIHHFWTFEAKSPWFFNFIRYLPSRLIALVIAQAIFILAHDHFGFSLNESFLIQAPVQPLVNFLAGYFYVFTNREPVATPTTKRWYFEVIFFPVLLFITLIYPFHNTKMQAAVWVAPYTSGAAHWTPGQPWKVAIGDEAILKTRTFEQRWTDVAPVSNQPDKLIQFSAHDEGWMWVLWFSKKAFPFLGDMEGVVLLAILIHLGLSLLILNALGAGWPRYLFTFLFICNPLTIHLVTFPYYYYWQAFASLIAIIIWLYRDKIPTLSGLIVPIFLLLCVAVRPNVIFISLACLGLLIYFKRHWLTYLGVLVFAAGFLVIPKVNKMVWHTVYVGLGAYPNSNGLYLADNSGYDLFKKEKNIDFDMTFGKNYYDPQVREEYNHLLKDESIRLIKAQPFSWIKTVGLNASIGVLSPYKPYTSPKIYYLQALLGLIFFAALIWFRQWMVIAGLILSIGCIALIYPPIAAYIVGGYVFTAYGFCQIILKIKNRTQSI